MQVPVQHDPDRTRFHVPPEVIDGDPHKKMANMGIVLNYRMLGDHVVDLHSTLVPPHLRGRGLGTGMAKEALEWARREGYRVVPTCPFVRDFLERNPEYQDVLAELA
jgi:predicted GNAT family acetyltransferase